MISWNGHIGTGKHSLPSIEYFKVRFLLVMVAVELTSSLRYADADRAAIER